MKTEMPHLSWQIILPQYSREKQAIRKSGSKILSRSLSGTGFTIRIKRALKFRMENTAKETIKFYKSREIILPAK
jgi:hypothetical protein